MGLYIEKVETQVSGLGWCMGKKASNKGDCESAGGTWIGIGSGGSGSGGGGYDKYKNAEDCRASKGGAWRSSENKCVSIKTRPTCESKGGHFYDGECHENPKGGGSGGGGTNFWDVLLGLVPKGSGNGGGNGNGDKNKADQKTMMMVGGGFLGLMMLMMIMKR